MSRLLIMLFSFMSLAMLSSTLRAQSEDDDLDFKYRETITTESVVRSQMHSFFIARYGCFYIYEEKILGCKAPTTVRKEYSCDSDVPEAAKERFFLSLEQAGIFDLKSDRDSDTICLDIEGTICGRRLERVQYSSPPKTVVAESVRKIVFDLISQLGLNQSCSSVTLRQKPLDYFPRISEVVEGDSRAARETTIKDILDNPAYFNGKRVSLVGYYSFAPGCQVLNTTEDGRWSIWLDAPSEYSSNIKLEHYNQKWVKVDATVNGHPGGFDEKWPATLVRITSVIEQRK